MSDKRGVLIVGGGLAAVRTAECLRREQYDGPITVVGEESHLPYDRTPLSKAVLLGKLEPEGTRFRDPEQLRQLGVTVLPGRRATRLDIDRNRVLANEEWVPFDQLVIATGSRARKPADFAEVEGVHALRTIEDAAAIRAKFDEGPRVVVVGAGFIGAEVASSARALGLDVTVVEIQPAPLVRAVGDMIAGAFARMHLDHGTVLHCGVGVRSVGHVRRQGRRIVENVTLSDGRVLPCDLLVLGLGVVPNVGWLEGSGLLIGDGVVCDSRLCAGPSNVHAAGDVAAWTDPATGRARAGQQWMSAVEQAQHVARRIVGKSDLVMSPTGYFWSEIYGYRIQFVGSTTADEVVIAQGALDAESYLALYRRGNRLVGALGKNNPVELMKVKTMLGSGRCEWPQAWDTLRARAA